MVTNCLIVGGESESMSFPAFVATLSFNSRRGGYLMLKAVHGYWSLGIEAITVLSESSSENENSSLIGMTNVLETTCTVRGGFGDVYRGELPDHRVVAVKCLNNIKAAEEKKGEFHDFWAEVTIVAMMQHLNLVRLWGFCAELGHRILVYGYVPNGSVDKYIFCIEKNRSSSDEPEKDTYADTERKPVPD
ncbi:hypothetical protein AgCh_000891 [Apium graveolens]